MDLHRLRIFTSVYRLRSFSKASKEMHLSQPTVSEHIRALEDEFQCKLFDRVSRTVRPTQEAEILFRQAVEILEKAEGLKELLRDYRREISGELIIGASSIPGTYLLPSLLAAFHQKYPAVSFELIIADSGEITQKILRHEILMGVTGTRYDREPLQFTPFKEDRLIAVAAPSALKASNFVLTELIKRPMVQREKGSGTRREWEKILEGQGVALDKIKTAATLGSTEAVKQAVKAGLSFSVLSRLSVKEELAAGSLIEIKIKNLTMQRNFYVVTHPRRTLPPAYRQFLQQLLK